MIPARLGSTRFPEKVLASQTGKPLIQHVFENAKRSSRLHDVIIATDHERVRRACLAFGARVVMTDEAHPNGTSRLAQAARELGLQDEDVVVNVQGDEPELEVEVIDACVDALLAGAQAGIEMATVGSPWDQRDDPNNPAIVKVVGSAPNLPGIEGKPQAQGQPQPRRALFFSRSCVPFPRVLLAGEKPSTHLLRHVGIYAYRQRFLQRYVRLPATPMERVESLEQLRVLEHNLPIALAIAASSCPGIDTPEQYDAFVARVRASTAAHP